MTALGSIQNSMAFPVMEVFPSWTSAALPEVWNDDEDLEYTYHGAQAVTWLDKQRIENSVLANKKINPY